MRGWLTTLSLLPLLCLAGRGGNSATAASQTDPRRDAVVEAVERAMPCVVNIATETIVATTDPLENLFREFFDPYYRRRQPNTQYSLGSGVVIDEEGFVLTNYHVVARANRIWVRFADGREFEAERVAGTSFTDVALLRIKAEETDKFPAIALAADDDLLLGETVLALGNPFGLGGSVSRGILSSKSRRPPLENEPLDVLDWLQTDAAINPGNSGGPLINLRGEMIGVNVAVYREGQGIGFAIPIRRISAALAAMYSPETLESLWFGARVRAGAVPLQVLAVDAQSPAEKAGLKPGDRILKVNGQTPRGFIDFNRSLLKRKDQGDVTLLVERQGEQRRITCRMVPEKNFFNAELIRRRLGLTLQEPTPELARRLGLPHLGLVVADVEENSPAGKANLQPGMLLASLDNKQLTGLVVAARAVHARAKGEVVQANVIVPRQRGPFVEYHEANVKLTLR